MDEQKRAEWFSAHISPYEAEIRGWLRRQVPNLSQDDLDDLIQEAYARIWRKQDLSLIRDGRPFFFKVARNLLLERVRRARIVSIEPIGDFDDSRISSNEPGPERQINAQQVLELARIAIARLPSRCRRVFELQRFEGLPYRDIAEQMGISEKTVQAQLIKALAYITEVVGSEVASVGDPDTWIGSDKDDTDDQEAQQN